jgi:hypothetical protein
MILEAVVRFLDPQLYFLITREANIAAAGLSW